MAKKGSQLTVRTAKEIQGGEFVILGYAGRSYQMTLDELKRFIGIIEEGGGSVDLTQVSTDILPLADASKDIGSLEKRWRKVYSTALTVKAQSVDEEEVNIHDGGIEGILGRDIQWSIDGSGNATFLSLKVNGADVATMDYVNNELSKYVTTDTLTKNYVSNTSLIEILKKYYESGYVDSLLSSKASTGDLNKTNAQLGIVQTDVATLKSYFQDTDDVDDIINKWRELEAFLAGQTETSTLADLLSVKADKSTVVDINSRVTDLEDADFVDIDSLRTTLEGYYTKEEVDGLLGEAGGVDLTGYVNEIAASETGNGIASVSKDGSKLTFTKANFLTSHQSLDGYINNVGEEASGNGNVVTGYRKSGKSLVLQKGLSVYSKDEVDGLIDGISIPSLDGYVTTETLTSSLNNLANTYLSFRDGGTVSGATIFSGGLSVQSSLTLLGVNVAAGSSGLTFDGKILMYSGDAYTKSEADKKFHPLTTVDTTPTLNSSNLVTSGGVAKAVADLAESADRLYQRKGSYLTSSSPLASANLDKNTITIASTSVSLGGSITQNQLIANLGLKGLAFRDSIDLSGYQPLITSTNKLAYSLISGTPTLATVATSGSYNDLSNKPTIPSAITESTVSGWGFTKNAGTITGIKMNGASKGTSGVVDLGTVLTSHQTIHGLTLKNSDESYSLTYTPNSSSLSITLSKSWVGLGNVENTKLSTWAGSAKITTLGTITSGTWNGSKIGQSYLDLSGYLPLSGGTLNGILNIDRSATDIYFRVIQSKTSKACFGWESGVGAYLYNYSSYRYLGISDEGIPFFRTSQGINALIHSGNISSYAVTSTTLNDFPRLNGTSPSGASATGTWGISISGSANRLEEIVVTDLNSAPANRIFTMTSGYSSTGGNKPTTYWVSGITFRMCQNSSYRTQLCTSDSDNLYYRAEHNGSWTDWKTIAFTDSTVAAANKLVNDNGNFVIYNNSYAFYVGDNLYTTLPTYILGKSVVLRYGESATYGLILNSSGNVTIGGSDLAGTNYKLYVNGKLHVREQIYSDVGFLLRTTDGTAVRASFSHSSNTLYIQSGYNDGSNTAGSMMLSGVSTKDLTLLNVRAAKSVFNGNVGIGTTDPNTKLHVAGGAKIEGGLTVGSSTDYIAYDGSSLTGYKSSASAWSIDPSGNGSFASITVDTYAYLRGGSTNPYLGLLHNNTNFYVQAYNGSLMLGAGVDNSMWIAANGNVEVQKAFDVNYADGYVRIVDGSIFSTYGTSTSWEIMDDGSAYFAEVNTPSDSTKKNILSNIELTASQIANAPAVSFTWTNSGRKSCGTIAQYWKNVLPEVVSGEEGSYGMNYAVLGVVSSIILARNIETHEQRIARLEEEISDLQKELNALVNNE